MLLQTDSEFRELADQHFVLIKSIKEVDERHQLWTILNTAHQEWEEKDQWRNQE